MMPAKHYREKYITETNVDIILSEIEKSIIDHCEKAKGNLRNCSISFKINEHCHDELLKKIICTKLIDLGYTVTDWKVCEGYGKNEHDISCWVIGW